MSRKNLIVGQSGGPTAVINSSLYGVVSEGMRHPEAIEHVYGMINGIEGFLNGTVLDFAEALPGEKLDGLKVTPGAYLGSCRYKLPESLEDPVYPRLFKKFEEMNIGWFFYIGGNDSMDTIKKLSDYAETVGNPIRFIGVPKTIDNDLEGTDHTPGYGSAAKYIATVTKELVRDGLIYEMQSVTVIEIMGRNAGWLTGAAVLAKSEDCEGPDLIYLPEVAFDVDDFLKKVKKLVSEKQSIVIAVSEGIKTADGRYVCELSAPSDKTDSFGHVQLSGTGKYLSDLIIEKLGCKSRAIELSTLQRCAGHLTSRVDITEAYQVGGTAVKAAFEGKTGQMVILKRVSQDPYICTTDLYDVHKVANLEKKVPRSWITEEGDYVTAEMKNYIEPLIQAELTPIMITGQPRHIIIDDL